MCIRDRLLSVLHYSILSILLLSRVLKSLPVSRALSQQEDELLPREAVPEALDGGPHPVGVVTAVQQESGRMPQQLEPARPAHLLEAGADGAVGDVPSPAPQHTEGRDSEGGVFRLIAADEGQTDTRCV